MLTSVLFGVGVAVSAAIGGAVVWGRLRQVRVARRARWAEAPKVWRDAGVDRARLVEAMRWWTARGHLMLVAISREDATVAIEVRPQPEGRLGNTHCWASAAGLLVRAEIEVGPKSSSLTLAHELGHALGYEHPDGCPTGHMMHPTSPGWDGRGLEVGT